MSRTTNGGPNPAGISEVELKIGNRTIRKTLAPKGFTELDFIEAGIILQSDVVLGQEIPYLSNTVISRSKYRGLNIQGYKNIPNPEISSWWFTNIDL